MLLGGQAVTDTGRGRAALGDKGGNERARARPAAADRARLLQFLAVFRRQTVSRPNFSI